MIPKTIHYCWFGHGTMPEIAKDCINSWKKFHPDYEIKLWNEENFDVNICQYTAEAYQKGKYAFVSDYARFWILYNYGGVYFDTDVKLLASLQTILDNGAFMGLEIDGTESPFETARCNPGIGMAAQPGMKLIKELLNRYNTYRFISPTDGSYNLKTIVEYTTEYLRENNFPLKVSGIINCAGFNIYPKEFFSPRSVDGRTTRITPNTISIHLFTNTWGNKSFIQKMVSTIKKIAICYFIPKSITLGKLNKNRMRREMYFKKNFIIS